MNSAWLGFLSLLERSTSHSARSPSALLEGLLARKKLSVRFVSGVSIQDVLVTSGLLIVLLLSAIGVVYSSHICRQLFSEHALLLEQNDQLQLEWAQLLLEESAWSAPTRIETVARDHLGMRLPDHANIELVQ
jgi:cell division protein FtsL